MVKNSLIANRIEEECLISTRDATLEDNGKGKTESFQ